MQVQDGIRTTAGPAGRTLRATAFRIASAVALLVPLASLASLTSVAVPPPAAASGDDEDNAHLLPGVRLLAPSGGIDLDQRTGRVEPTSDQRAALDALGADVRWTRFATPASLSFPEGDPAVPDVPADAAPEEVARGFVAAHAGLFRLSGTGVDRLEVIQDVPLAETAARVVTFRQRFGADPALTHGFPEDTRGGRSKRFLTAGAGGLITVGITGDGQVTYVSSSAYGSPAVPLPRPRVTPEDAWIVAATSLGRAANQDAVRSLDPARRLPGWHRFTVTGFAQVQQVRLVAVGMPRAGRTVVRPAYEANVVDVRNGAALAATAFVDAVTGRVLIRHDRVDHLLPSAGRTSGPHTPLRPVPRALDLARVGCPPRLLGCGVWQQPEAAAPSPIHAALLGRPATSQGRYAWAARPSDPWMTSGCDISRATAAGDAAAAQRYVLAVRGGLLSWLHGLGLPVPDDPSPPPTHVRAGALTGGYPTYLGRNNAVQVTLQSGIPGIGGHYLFEPIAGQWYGRCADGALDPTLVAHEYVHAMTERLVGGPDGGIVSSEGRAVAESWSDLLAAEFLRQSRPGQGGTAQGDPDQEGAGSSAEVVIGGYVAGNPARGIRNYPPSDSPLNATNLGYAAAAPWSDGEIWTAVNHRLRHVLGARTWLRLLIDSLPLQQGRTSMTDARDALLAADRMRFDGAHAARIWRVLARHGLGEGARPARAGTPAPSFTSPMETEGVLQVEAMDAGTGRAVPAEVYVGRFGAGSSVPIADTEPDTDLPARAEFAPGRYELTWRAPGYGMGRTHADIDAGRTTALTLRPHQNLASAAAGARAYEREPDLALVNVSDSAEPDSAEPDGAGPDGAGPDGAGSEHAERDGFDRTGHDSTGNGPLTGSVTGMVTRVPRLTGLTGLGTTLLGGRPARRPPFQEIPPPGPGRAPGRTPATDPPESVPDESPGVSPDRSPGRSAEKSFEPAGKPSAQVSTDPATDPRTGSAVGLIDDSEEFGWTARDVPPDAAGHTVTVDLVGIRPRRIGRVALSALPRPERPGATPPSPFSAPRRFAIEICSQTNGTVCTAGADRSDDPAGADLVGHHETGGDPGPAQGGRWRRIYTSPTNAFPAGRPRPVPADLTFRSFDVPDTWATHVRLVVLDTQCTGNPAYHGRQSADPLTGSDCRSAPAAHQVTVAELMVYGTGRG